MVTTLAPTAVPLAGLCFPEALRACAPDQWPWK